MTDPNRILFCAHGKDGGPESRVFGFWLFRWKRLCTIALFRFEDGIRDAYHSHAFNSVSWVLKGKLKETHFLNGNTEYHTPSLVPILTKRNTFHRVTSFGRTYVLTLRGPWAKTWSEYIPNTRKHVTLTHGRKVVSN
jgi:hypothetical protein